MSVGQDRDPHQAPLGKIEVMRDGTSIDVISVVFSVERDACGVKQRDDPRLRHWWHFDFFDFKTFLIFFVVPKNAQNNTCVKYTPNFTSGIYIRKNDSY